MRQIAWGVLAAGMISTTAMAQEAVQPTSLVKQVQAAAAEMAPATTAVAAQTPAPDPAPKKTTVVVGADMPLLTGYVFRGIVQEFDPGFTFQPFVDVGYAATSSLTFNVGSWNSFHSGSNADDLDAPFYESDFYVSATGIVGKWKPGVLFTVYGSPDDAFNTVYELAGVVSYDDSAARFPMSPRIVLAFELDDNGQADGGQFFDGNQGIYLETGIRPTFKASPDSALTFAVPVKFGFSLKDYYETVDANGDVEDNGFGYFQFGANVSVPLPIDFGSWEVHGGMDFYVFGDNRKVQQADDDEPTSFKPVLNFGFSATF